jgi:hypothetical protein
VSAVSLIFVTSAAGPDVFCHNPAPESDLHIFIGNFLLLKFVLQKAIRQKVTTT